MASFTLRNKLDQSLPISWIDLTGKQQDYMLQPLAKITVEADALTTQTQRLIRDKYLASGDAQQPVVLQAPTVLEILPLSYAGVWQVGRFFKKGQVVEHEGSLFMALTDTTATAGSPPDTSINWFYFSISAPETYFGVDASSVTTGELLMKTESGWKADLVSDENVNTLSQSKVTGLVTALSNKLGTGGGTLTGALTLSGAPTLNLHAATKAYVDTRLSRSSVVDADRTLTLPLFLPAGNPTQNLHAAHKAYVDSTLGTRLPLAGGTLTGPLVLSGPPATAQQAANRDYVDTGLSQRVPFSGGLITGNLGLNNAPTLANHATRKDYVDGQITALSTAKVSKAGDTMSGFLTLHADPTDWMHASTKKYVDLLGTNLTAAISLRVAKTGDAMSGPLTLPASNPTSGNHATRKSYVDGLVATQALNHTRNLSGVTQLTGGGSGELDGVSIASLNAGQVVSLVIGNIVYFYILTAEGGPQVESPPLTVVPDVPKDDLYWRLLWRADLNQVLTRLYDVIVEGTLQANTVHVTSLSVEALSLADGGIITFGNNSLDAVLTTMGLTTEAIQTKLRTAASYVEANKAAVPQALTDGAAAVDVTFESEVADTMEDYANNEFIVRTAGRHMVNVSVTLTGGSATQFGVYLLVNGTSQYVLREGPVGATEEVLPVSMVLNLAVSDTVKIQATQTSGGARSISGATSKTFFKIASLN